MKDTILVVDDEKSVRVLLRELLENEAYSVYEAGSLSELTAFLQNMVPDIVILDLGLPDGSGIEIIPAIKEKCKNTEVIVITAMGTVDNAVDSMKLGAYDFITKPFDTRKIRRSVERALNYVKVRRENMALKLQQKNHLYYEEFIGECTQIQELNKLVHKLAFADVPILITGETGTGKNILAKQIHFTLSDKNAPLVYTNCSSIPDSLFESELFGHEKGAFTGAGALKKGRVEQAENGTLILDEITEMPYELQAKILNFIQEKSFYRVGGNRQIAVSTRIIALSNRNMQEEVSRGRFRKDLYYRLNVVHVQVPPLKDRGEDVLVLAEYFMSNFKTKYGKTKTLSADANNLLKQYSWPGNVRELKNVLERVYILSESDVIESSDIRFESGEVPEINGDLKSLLNDFEKKVIIRSLAENGGNRTQTAEKLGISLRNLQYKLSRYDLVD